jgi:APA family basic amino acid/polyamine antiporter
MSNEYKLLNDQVGLWAGVALLVGTAVGMSIFIVPTQMLAEAGPSITIAILLSIPPMVLAVLGLLQLGGALPVAGGAYLYSSRLIGPLFGILGVFIPVLAIWAYLLFAALGFAEYLEFFFREFLSTGFGSIETLLVMWAVLGTFVALNYVGVRVVTTIQLGMVAILLTGLVVFIAAGVLEISGGNYEPLFPDSGNAIDGTPAPFAEGVSPFIIAVVTLYIPFQGFSMIVEIGEELENPIENIPRVLAIGMSIVVVLSIAVVAVLAGVVPWQNAPELVEEGGGLALALTENGAATWTGVAVAVAALIGAVTTINTLITSYSRTVMRAARDDVLPPRFAKIHDEYGTPTWSILALGVPPLVLAPVVVFVDGLTAVDALDWLVVVVVSGIFVVFTFLGWAIWRLPKVFPDRYEHSFYKLPKPLLIVVAVGNTVISFVLALLVGTERPSALAVVLLWMVVAYGFYRYRERIHSGEGSFGDTMSGLDSHE